MLGGAVSELVFPRKAAWSGLRGREAAMAVGQCAAPRAELGKDLGGRRVAEQPHAAAKASFTR